MKAPSSLPYEFKPEPHSSHSIILDWLADGQGRRLLDVGAADGLLSRHLTQRGWRVTAIERDPAAAAAGAAHCERMIVADLTREIPDAGGPFDAIVYADILEHLTEPLEVLRAIDGHLAPGGRVLISIPNVAHLYMRLGLLLGRFDYVDRGVLDGTHLRFFTQRSLRVMLEKADLEPVRRTVTPVPLYKVVSPRWHGRGLAGVHALSAAAARVLPRLLGYQFIVLARLADRATA